jgi:hypothetical protein
MRAPDGSTLAPFHTHAQVVHCWHTAIAHLNADKTACFVRKRRPLNYTVYINKKLNDQYWEALAILPKGRGIRHQASPQQREISRWLRANHVTVCYTLHRTTHPFILEARDDTDNWKWPSLPPVWASFMNRICKSKNKVKVQEQEQEQETCSICLDTLNTAPIDPFACGHYFHKKCIVELKEAKFTHCPLCRAAFS